MPDNDFEGQNPTPAPDNNWSLRVSAEETRDLLAYMTELNDLIENEPAHGSAKEWVAWNEQVEALNAKYGNVLLNFAISCADISGVFEDNYPELIRDHLYMDDMPPQKPEKAKGLLTNDFLPIMNNTTTNELTKISAKDFVKDPVTNKGKYVRGNVSFEISNFDALYSPMETSAKKLLDTAILYLGYINYGRNVTQPVVMIPLIEYGEANGKNLTPRTMPTKEEQDRENARVQEHMKEFKARIRRDLENIQHTRYTTTETKGRYKGNYIDQGIISSHAIVRENGTTYIRITFDYNMAQYLANSYMAQYPTSLLGIDNRNATAYAIGRKIAMHNSNDRNAAAGTANTLKVSTLIESAPDLQTYEELKESGQRNWKLRTKKPLEKALNVHIGTGYIISWVYRDPKTGINYSPEEANSLSWSEYYNLDVDFELQKNPKQDKRRQKKAVERAKRANPDSKEKAHKRPQKD